MKRLLTFVAMLAGVFSIMVSTSSCKDKEECCEWTYDNTDYRACEDDAILESTGYDWSYWRAAAISYGGSCDD